MDLSLAFLMTEANRYADVAKRILPEIVSWPTDDDDVTSVSARWGDEPGLSSSKCAHFAYDWFYDALNGGEKQIVFKMCEDRARQTYRYLTNPASCHAGRLLPPPPLRPSLWPANQKAQTPGSNYSLKAMITFYQH